MKKLADITKWKEPSFKYLSTVPLQSMRLITVSCLLTLFHTLHIRFPVCWPCKPMVTSETLCLSCLAVLRASDCIFAVQLLGVTLWSLICINNWSSNLRLNSTSSPSEEQLTFIFSRVKHIWDTAGSDTGAERQISRHTVNSVHNTKCLCQQYTQISHNSNSTWWF